VDTFFCYDHTKQNLAADGSAVAAPAANANASCLLVFVSHVQTMSEDSPSEVSVASYNASGSEDSFAKKIYKKLAHDSEITTSEHIEAVDALCKLQYTVENTGRASKQAQIKLICVVSSLHRRVIRMEEEIAWHTHYQPDGKVGADMLSKVHQLKVEILNLKRTASLVFVAIVSLDVIALGGQPADAEASFQSLDDALDRSLWQELCKHSKRRLEVPDDVQYNEKQRILAEDIADSPFVIHEDSSSWSKLMAQPGLLANAAVRAAGSMLSSKTDDAMQELEKLAVIFSESTSAQMAVQMLKSEQDFMTLATRRISQLSPQDRENALSSVVAAAESESGQSVLRDMIISFLLPRKAVGKRRTLLLSREASAKASKSYPWIASLAHEAAMQGAEHIFQNSKSELKRSVALLTGLAMLTTSGTDDVIRKATAFSGLVQLPFLETVPPRSRKQPRLALVPTTRAWTLYTLSPSGKPVVEISNRGFEGLVLCLLCFREHV
jgi:hypothetical protein